MEMALKTNIVQVTNVAPVATLEQMSTLFGFLGKILDIKLYPSDDYIFQPTSRVCYLHFADPWSVGVAQHLTNTVFIDRALIVVPIAEDTIPDETKAMALTSPSASVPSLIANSPVINQSHVWLLEHESKDGFMVEADGATASEASTMEISREKVTGVGTSQVIQTMDPRLSALGLPQYPPLPANMDPLKVEEIRRTVYVGNLDSTLTAEQLLKFFNQIGEVKYVRMAGDETQPTRFAFVEFTDQTSVASALQYNGVIYGGRPLKINHSNNAIVKPQAKSSEAAQREIEEAMKRVREAQSLITAAIEPELVEKKSDRSRSRSRSRRRSGSRSRKRSRSRSHSRKRSSRRSHSRHRSRSRRHRSRSREHKSRSRSKERKKRSVSPRSRRDKSRSHSSERSKKRPKKSRSRSRSKSSTRSKTSVSSKSKDSHKSEKKSKDKSKEKSPKKEKSSKKDSEKEVKPKVEPQPEEKVDTPKVVANTSNEELGPPILTPEIPFKDPNNFVKLEAEDTVDKTELEKRPPSAGEKPESADSADDTKEDIDTSLDDRGAITSPAKENEFKVGELDVDLRMIKPVEKVSKKEHSSSPRRKSRSPSRASRSPSYSSRSVSKRHSRSPSKRRSRSPVKKWSRSPSKRRSKSPVKKRSRSPVRRVSRSPSKRSSRSPSKRPSRSPSRKRSHSRSRKRSRTPSKLSRRRISPSPSPIRRRSRSPGRRRRSRSGSRVYPRKRRISRSPRRRSRTPRRRTRSPSYRRRSRGPRRSRTPVRRRRSPSRTSRTQRLSRSPRRRSRSPRRRTRTRSRSGSPKRDSRHKKRKDKDRDHSRDRKKKRRDEDKERSGSSSKDMKVVRNYDEEEKGYDSSHDVESKRSSSVSKPREDVPPKPPVDSDASDRRSGDMDLDSD